MDTKRQDLFHFLSWEDLSFIYKPQPEKKIKKPKPKQMKMKKTF